MESGLLSPESVLEVCSWIPESGFGSPEFGHGVQKWESRCGVWSQKSWSLDFKRVQNLDLDFGVRT